MHEMVSMYKDNNEIPFRVKAPLGKTERGSYANITPCSTDSIQNAEWRIVTCVKTFLTSHKQIYSSRLSVAKTHEKC